MNGFVEQLLPYVVSGAVAGLVSWVTMRVDLRYLRRDVDQLRDRVHGPNNPRNILSVQQELENRVSVLETIQDMPQRRQL